MPVDNEIIVSFKEEAKLILQELETVIENLEEHQGDFPKALLEDFANKTDRIMGTAHTFFTQYPDQEVFLQIGKFGALCKATGYKASTLNHIILIPIFAAFWADTVEIMNELCNNIDNPDKLIEINKKTAPVLQRRLTWLAEQIVKITKSDPNAESSKINVDGLLKKLGIQT
jgi:hypothetical protein